MFSNDNEYLADLKNRVNNTYDGPHGSFSEEEQIELQFSEKTKDCYWTVAVDLMTNRTFVFLCDDFTEIYKEIDKEQIKEYV